MKERKEQDTAHSVAYGQADTSSLSPVDTNTLFQAASLSKPVSAAIILDWVDQGKWDLGMGLYHSSDPEKTIAFHWGNNTGSISFCAIDMATGDCVVNFSNAMNGPTVFQKVAEPIVGDITPLFQ